MFSIDMRCFWTSPRKNHAESFGNYGKGSLWDLKWGKSDQNVRTYCWLNKLRNTHGKIYGTYLGKIYRMYKENIRYIHKYLWYKIIRNTDPMGRRRRRRLCFWLFYIIIIYGYSLYVPYIFHIYFLNMFHIIIWTIYFPVCVS